MRTLAAGWCPKHDRVYERANRCPECGTELVPVERVPSAPPEAEAASPVDAPPKTPSPRIAFGPWHRRGAVAVALLLAFGLGSIVSGSDPAPDAPGTSERRDIRPRNEIARSADGTAIRIALMMQDGDQFFVRFEPETGGPDPRLIQDAAVEVTTKSPASGGEQTYSVSDPEVRSDADGFSIDGRLASSDPIKELRITSIQIRDDSNPSWGANLGKVWPVGAADEPRVLRLNDAPRSVEGGTIRLTALLCWSDRVEAVFELLGDDGSPGNRSEMVGLELRTSVQNSSNTLVGRAIAASKTDLISAGQMVARFESVPEDAGPIVILATRMLSFVAGPWTWGLQ